MLLEELVGGVEHHAAGIRIADGFDFGGRHGVGFVAEVIAHEDNKREYTRRNAFLDTLV
jgi:hypothetical protein